MTRKPKRPPVKKDPCAPLRSHYHAEKSNLRKAAAIVAQVLVHFGAGFAIQRETANASAANDSQIFATPADLAAFHDLLLTSVVKHLSTLNWDTDGPGRDAVCLAAFKHGDLAGQTSPTAPLTFTVILTTLRTIQEEVCPPGAGGGPVCDF